MKKGFNVLMILFIGVMIMSCDSNASYTDMLKAEKKAINRLIDREDLEILKNFPINNTFEDNQYVKLDNDVYIQVVDTGDGTWATQYSTKILCRFTANRFMLDSTTYETRWSNCGPNSNGTSPVEFIYGSTTAISQSFTSSFQLEMEGFLSEGFQAGLEYVGNRGKVRLIVPFKRGGSTDQTNGWPVHFEDLEYKFE